MSAPLRRLGGLIIALPLSAYTASTPTTATTSATPTTTAVATPATTAPVAITSSEPSTVDVVLAETEYDDGDASEALCALRGELRSTYAALYDEWKALLQFAETSARVVHIAEHAAEALVLWQGTLPRPSARGGTDGSTRASGLRTWTTLTNGPNSPTCSTATNNASGCCLRSVCAARVGLHVRHCRTERPDGHAARTTRRCGSDLVTAYGEAATRMWAAVPSDAKWPDAHRRCG